MNTPETKLLGAPHVGIDEWAWHRGHRYGTLIVNLDTHRPLVLLPGCDQCTLAAWFRKYPEIQVVLRDRGGIYATAAREDAPQARQGVRSLALAEKHWRCARTDDVQTYASDVSCRQ